MSEVTESRRSTPVSVTVVASGAFLIDSVLVSSLVTLLPFFGTELGIARSSLGLIAGAFAAGTLVALFPIVVLASHLSSRILFVTGLGVMALSSLLFGLADSVGLLFASRFGLGVGSSLVWTGALAWSFAYGQRTGRGRKLSAALGAATLGGLLGPALGAVAIDTNRVVTFALVAALLVALAVSAVAYETPAVVAASHSLRVFLRALREPSVVSGIWLVSLPAILFGAFGVLAPLQLSELGFTASQIAVLFLATGVIRLSIAPFLGYQFERDEGRSMLMVSLAVAGIASLALAIFDGWVIAGIATVAASLAYGTLWIPGMARLASAGEELGLAGGVALALQSLWAPASIVGSVFVGGLLGGLLGSSVAFATSAILALGTLAAGTTPRFRRHLYG